MWTPKRIVLLAFGVMAFFLAYELYARALGLGRIDGLPPLPETYVEDSTPVDDSPVPLQANETDQKLQQAFGEQCKEISLPVRLWVPAKHLALAAGEFNILDDGRIRLAPFRLAVFGKVDNPGAFPEISTISSDEAILTFDRPINTITDMSNRKITAGTLTGEHISMRNNRKTRRQDDDIVVNTPGPVRYEENQHLIWTDNVVELKEFRPKQDPTVITANGMELTLAAETGAARPGQPAAGRKPKTDSGSEVESVLLRSDVSMHLQIESGFMDSQKKPGGAQAQTAGRALPSDGKGDADAAHPDTAGGPAPPAQKAPPVVIETPGPFRYDIRKEFAQFDVARTPTWFANRVKVTRIHEDESNDVLDCEHLELQFRRKEAAPDAGRKGTAPDAADDRAGGLEIQSAHATGKEVKLTSDAEELVAHGNDFFYDALVGRSTLKGEQQMWAVRKGDEIHARELQILDQRGQQQASALRHATALGPGTIDMFDEKTKKSPRHASWKDKLVSTKDDAFDLLILTGDAAFTDDEHGQELHAETLTVWLEPAETAASPGEPSPPAGRGRQGTPGSTAADAPPGGRRPHHLKAKGHVLAKSKDPPMDVHDTDELNILFRDAPPTVLPQPGSGNTTQGNPEAQPAGAGPAGATGTAAPPGSGNPGQPGAAGAEPAKVQKPIELVASYIDASVLRSGTKNDLDKLRCQGKVHVLQEGAEPGDQGVEIEGEELDLTHKLEGNLLIVREGATGDLARLRMDKLFIVGPEVNIDQVSNQAWVNGSGAMESSAQWGGAQREAKPVPEKKTGPPELLTIHFTKLMVFNGKEAEFHGGVQAEQGNAHLLCQAMRVSLDRMVSLKGEDKGQPKAQVQNVVCDQGVRIEDTQMEEGKFVRYNRIEGPVVTFDTEEGIVISTGPGVARVLQRGSAEAGAGGPFPAGRPTAPKPGSQDELKLTIVKFGKRMWGNNKTRMAIFYENVEVFNLPSANPDATFDKTHIPDGGLYLSCDQLKVYTRQENVNGKSTSTQEMEARSSVGKVVVKAKEFTAVAEQVTYHEGKDQVIFEGGEAGLAKVFKFIASGAPPDVMTGRKILYARRTGEFKLVEGQSVTGGTKSV